MEDVIFREMTESRSRARKEENCSKEAQGKLN